MMYFFVFMMSVSNFPLQAEEERNDTYGSFEKVFADHYNVLFIGTTEEFHKMRFETQVLYVVETNFLIIICLNILISVVTDNYDTVITND